MASPRSWSRCPVSVAVVDPAEGGGIGTWDIRAVRHALTAVMRRRPEAYHARLLASEATAGTVGERRVGGGGRDDPRSRAQPRAGTGCPASLRCLRTTIRARPPVRAGTTSDAFADGEATELGDPVDGAYDVVSLESDANTFALRRDVSIGGRSDVVRVEKRFCFGEDRARPTLDLEVNVENRSAVAVRFDLGVEWALTMLGGGGNPAAFYRFGDDAMTHDSTGQRDDVGTVVSGNDYHRDRADHGRRAGRPGLVVADRDDLELRVRLRAGLPGQRAGLRAGRWSSPQGQLGR